MGLLLWLSGARLQLELVWRAVANGAQRADTLGLPEGAASALVGLGLWLLHWPPSSTLWVAETQALLRRLHTYLALIGGTLAHAGAVAAIAAYHWQSLRADTRRAATARVPNAAWPRSECRLRC